MRQLAGFFPASEYPQVLVGLGEPDDAAVFQLDESRAIIQTTDFFTPVVDDPWTYGSIAAANAMSDVYAMGGDVLFCLNIAGFPDDLPAEHVAQIFAGGAAKVREAGAAITGGHTVNNPEPFYGLSVTGIVHPDQVMRKRGAKPGDRLVLTKPLGTGLITTAAKLTGPAESATSRRRRRAEGQPDVDIRHLDAAIISMSRLNRTASRAAQAVGVVAATDITGFGLLGHAAEMVAAAQLDGVCFRLRAADIPLLAGAADYAAAGYLTRGSSYNPAAFGASVHFASEVTPIQRTVLWEVETSGGLLLAVPPERLSTFASECTGSGQAFWEIGEVVSGMGIEVV